MDVTPGAGIAARVRREAGVLAALASFPGVPSPELVAFDVDGSAAGGVPALLMARLPGRIELSPADRGSWLQQMAALLPHIHALTIAAQPYQSWTAVDALEVPAWSHHPSAWQMAIDLVREGMPPARPAFLHRDFQHFNMLWSRGRLSGVVDWVEASNGPPDVDVGHCCLNLAVLYSAGFANEFRLRYESEAGRAVDPRYLLDSILGYNHDWQRFIPIQVGGRVHVDIAGMDGRIEEMLLQVLKRC